MIEICVDRPPAATQKSKSTSVWYKSSENTSSSSSYNIDDTTFMLTTSRTYLGLLQVVDAPASALSFMYEVSANSMVSPNLKKTLGNNSNAELRTTVTRGTAQHSTHRLSPSSSRRSRASRSPHSQAPISKAVRSAGFIDFWRSYIRSLPSPSPSPSPLPCHSVPEQGLNNDRERGETVSDDMGRRLHRQRYGWATGRVRQNRNKTMEALVNGPVPVRESEKAIYIYTYIYIERAF